MAYYRIRGTLLSEIADSIREKAGDIGKISPKEMPTIISMISTGIVPSESMAISKNGIYDVTNFSSIVVRITLPVAEEVTF